MEIYKIFSVYKYIPPCNRSPMTNRNFLPFEVFRFNPIEIK